MSCFPRFIRRGIALPLTAALACNAFGPWSAGAFAQAFIETAQPAASEAPQIAVQPVSPAVANGALGNLWNTIGAVGSTASPIAPSTLFTAQTQTAALGLPPAAAKISPPAASSISHAPANAAGALGSAPAPTTSSDAAAPSGKSSANASPRGALERGIAYLKPANPQDTASLAARLHEFWNHGKKSSASENEAVQADIAGTSAVASSGAEATRPVSAVLRRASALATSIPAIALPLPALAATAASHVSLLSEAARLVTSHSHILLPAGVIAATWIVNHWVLHKTIGWVGKKLGWSEQKISLRQTFAEIAGWFLGLTYGMHFVGVNPLALLGMLGGSGLSLGLVLRQPFGNIIKGGLLLFSRLLEIGDRVTIEKKDYIVKDWKLQYIVLSPVGNENRHRMDDYSKIADLPITVYRKPDFRKGVFGLSVLRRNALPRFVSIKNIPRSGFWKSVLLPAAGVAALIPLVKLALPLLKWTAGIPYLSALGIAAGTFLTVKFTSRLLRRFLQNTKLDPNLQLVLRGIASGILYLAGATWAIEASGTSWAEILSGAGLVGTGLLGGVGLSMFVVGIAAYDIVSNVFYGRMIKLDQRIELGDSVQISDFSGTVYRFSGRYLVLKGDGEEEKYIWIPYSYIASNGIEVLRKYEPMTENPVPTP